MLVAWIVALIPALAIPSLARQQASAPAVAGAVPDRGEYLVRYRRAASSIEARSAIAAAGGVIVRENAAVGVAMVRVTRRDGLFLSAVGRRPTLAGAVPNVPIGRLLREAPNGHSGALRAEGSASGVVAPEADASQHRVAPPGVDPLAPLQWDMALIGATAECELSR
jgi:hypothetical protein